MKNYKLIAVGQKTLSNGMKMIETKIDLSLPCKTCAGKPRRMGSAYCEDCARDYRVRKFEEQRLARRVEGAKIKN